MTTHHLDTKLLHIGSAPFDPETGTAPVNLPSMRTSTVRFENLAALERVFAKRAAGERAISYGRSGMDTHRALEEVFMQLEGGTYCVLAPSGMAAIQVRYCLKCSTFLRWPRSRNNAVCCLQQITLGVQDISTAP